MGGFFVKKSCIWLEWSYSDCMSSASIIISFVIWIAVWYGIFYFRYENRWLINSLRKTVKKQRAELDWLTEEYEEYATQNDILKEKTREVLAKNDDLSKIVSELSRYYYHIKTWAEKVKELSRFLSTPDPKLEPQLHDLDMENEMWDSSYL